MTEFEFLKSIKNRFNLKNIGDDCSVIPKDAENDLLFTADLLIEDIDFRCEWAIAEHIGHKALAVSLSDIAAMGGTPKWAMISIGVTETLWNSTFLDEFYKGWHDLAVNFEVELIGGDISRSPDKLVVDVMVVGEVAKGTAVMRSGAKPGDGIYVSGPLGGAAAGLKILLNNEQAADFGSDDKQNLVMKQLRPLPQIQLGNRLRKERFATAMIDISDGLSSDLGHLCSASSVGAVINVNNIPFDAETLKFTGSIDETLQLALNGGEDFELLFSANDEKMLQLGLSNISRIGEITANVETLELIRDDDRKPLPQAGFKHF